MRPGRMKRDKLSGRLSRLRESRAPAVQVKGPASGNGPSPGEEWRQSAPFVFERTVLLPAAEEAGGLFDSGAPLLFGPGDPEAGIVFYDLETTGLSGGAGTIVFLAGFLRAEPGPEGMRLTAVQLFLSDYPGERAFLERIASMCAPEALFVSYNGKSFDRHLLLGRGRMHGIGIAMPRQLDLLHPARKFWKRDLPDCSLSTVEKSILGLSREMDIPGAEIPDRYFSWLRDGDPETMRPVFAHHLQDLHSLVLLLGRFEAMAADPASCTPAEKCALGEYALRGGKNGALSLLLEAFEEGDGKAGRIACVQLKRMEEREQAMKVARMLWERERSPFAAVELAKHLEHRLKEFRGAMDIVDSLLARPEYLSPGFVRALRHRRARLERRL